MNETENLGTAKVKVEVDNTATEPGLKEAEKKVDNFAKSTVSSLRNATRAVTQFIGAFTAVAGVAFVAYRVGRAIREGITEALMSGKDKADAFVLALDFTKPEESIKALDDRLREINGQIAANQESWSDWYTNILQGATTQKLIDERQELRERRQSQLRLKQAKDEQAATKEAAEKRAAEEEKAEQRAMAAAKEVASTKLALDVALAQSAEERARLVAGFEFREAEDRINATEGMERELHKQRLALVYELHAEKVRLAKEEDAKAREMEAARVRAAERSARQIERAFDDAFKRIREQAKNILPVQAIQFQAEQINEALGAVRAQNQTIDISGGSAVGGRI